MRRSEWTVKASAFQQNMDSAASLHISVDFNMRLLVPGNLYLLQRSIVRRE